MDYTKQRELAVQQLATAQIFYQAHLRSEGIKDPTAEVRYDEHLGFIGVPGIKRKGIGHPEGREGLCDILEPIVIEINRANAGLKPLDKDLVARLKLHSPNGTLARIVA
ncbi:MAG: hypothetical protein AABX00_00960 [Nanoarchaeota archaeon]